jgi:Uma2 family endonuclease
MAEVREKFKRIPMSREEFEKLPEGPPFYDYINGEAIEVNRPTGRHQHVVGRLWHAIVDHLQANNLGECWFDIDVLLPTGSVVGPDISILFSEHLDRYDKQKGDIIGAPDIVVEVSLPTTIEYDRTSKLSEYHRSGVQWVWFVDQETLTVEEFQWTPEGYLLRQVVKGGDVFRPRALEGFEVNLKRLLRE